MSIKMSSEAREPIIGIDLGTTYSCLACWDEKSQQVEVISSPSGRTMPSWVAFTSQGKLVGAAAKAQVASNPKNTVYDAKRIIGRSFQDAIVQEERKSFPFAVVSSSSNSSDDGPAKICVEWRGKSHQLSPEEISAMVLSELKVAAERKLGRTVKQAVITVPAHFNNQQRQATKDAGRIAGLEVRRIINEPTAAALAYGLHSANANNNDTNDTNKNNDTNTTTNDKNNVVIYDLGGGTFDVSVLTMDQGVFEVKATGGDTHLGGEDFDNSVVNWCWEQLLIEQESTGRTDAVTEARQKKPRAAARLRRAVEQAKRTLSESRTAVIEVDSLCEDVDLHLTLTRAKFEELNARLFRRCVETVREVLTDAKVALADVTDVVLVGGSTRVPFLQNALYELFDKRIELCKSVHPDEAVAIGAAVQGHILASGGSGGGQDLAHNTTTDLLLLDVTPLSLGIELEGRVMSTLIKRNTAIPCQKTRTYTTVDDWQTDIDVVVYEGERPCVDANHPLGSFVVSGVQKARAGEPKVDVTFALDANGILHVSARDQVTGSKANATMKAEKGRLTQDDIDRMVADAERYRAQDEDLAVKMAYKTALEEALYTAQSKVGEGEEMDGTSSQANELELCNLMDWLELDSDTATLDEMKSRGKIVEERFGIAVGGDNK